MKWIRNYDWTIIMPWIFSFLTFLISFLLQISHQCMAFAPSLDVKAFHFDISFLFSRLISTLLGVFIQFVSIGDWLSFIVVLQLIFYCVFYYFFRTHANFCYLSVAIDPPFLQLYLNYDFKKFFSKNTFYQNKYTFK